MPPAATFPDAALKRFETVILGLSSFATSKPFSLHHDRFAFDKEPEGGRDGAFRVEDMSTVPLRLIRGTEEAWRTITLSVMVAYWNGGGGVAANGNDVNRNAIDDSIAIVTACEDPSTYDGVNTGIRIVHYRSLSRFADLPKCEIWQTQFDVECQSFVVA